MAAFNQGDEVLVFYQNVLYDAKINRVKLISENVWRYGVHYKGWNSSYDEWVEEDRVMPINKENLRLQKKLHKEAARRATEALANNDARNSVDESQKKPQSKTLQKLKRVVAPAGSGLVMESQARKEDGGPPEYVAVQVAIPRRLRTKLLDHRDLVRAGKLAKLPLKPSVNDVLQMYPGYRRGEEIWAMEMSKRLRYYFNSLLEPMLLYDEERWQFKEAIVEKNLEPSVVYGADHLLRLFVKLPELLQTQDYTEDELTSLENELQIFLRFMEERGSEIFG